MSATNDPIDSQLAAAGILLPTRRCCRPRLKQS